MNGQEGNLHLGWDHGLAAGEQAVANQDHDDAGND